MKSLGYTPDEEDMSQMEEQNFYSGLIIKIGARCFFCNQDGHFRMDCPLFRETLKNQNHPKHKLAAAALQNNKNRQDGKKLQKKEVTSGELATKTVKAATKEREEREVMIWESLKIGECKNATEEKVSFKEELEELGLDQESVERLPQ